MNGRILKNRYQIVRELGTGGQGITYLAEDLSLSGKPHCVVKQLRPADPKTLNLARRLFEQEINALGRLGDHPQIPRLLDHFEEGDQFYLVQQYIEGHPLSQYIVPSQPWSENQVNGMLRELLPILDFIHNEGVIHRDIKPNNIIRRKYDQKLVLIDFGSIKQVISSELIITQQNQVRTTVIVGTEGYMPHQQKQGNVSPSSDLYAIGMMAIEAATGISAIDLQMQYSDPQTGEIIWKRFAPQISDHLANILSKMIAYIPGNRYQSAKDIQKELGIVIDNPSQWKCVQTIIGHRTSVNNLVLTSNSQQFASASDDNTIKLWEVASSKLIRTFTIVPGFMKPDSTYYKCVKITPEANILISGSLDNKLRLWHLHQGNLIATINAHKDCINSIDLHQDGQTLVSGSRDKTIKVWHLGTRGLLRNLLGHTNSVTAVLITPDGQKVISASLDNTVKIWSLANGKLIFNCTGHLDSVWAITISPNGKTVASGSNDGTIKLWNLETGNLLKTLTLNSKVNSIAIAPDNTTLVAGLRDGNIKLWNLQTGGEIFTTSGHSKSVNCVAFSHNQQAIISGCGDGMIKIWQPLS
ncbi:serine/threonine-protein kinase [Planktothrix mougeotii]|uniref:Serine/threonine protein kinase n=1 Tax=Planktothrix mougeotii LEGE 06226 TaxID=1828728 RepID=A0ABR9UKG4_9CYAN|nr:serine/threonine-protein kinase [Planktothrix mougeotii]MBE9146039.1 serine/threonine protein kinase [Planktothrix mougeotii LEGE 06226]